MAIEPGRVVRLQTCGQRQRFLIQVVRGGARLRFGKLFGVMGFDRFHEGADRCRDRSGPLLSGTESDLLIGRVA